VKTQALRWIVAGSLLVSSQLIAEPLNDLQARLAAMHNDQPMRVKVDIEVEHRGTAPLHLNKNMRRGRATVAYGPQGVKMIESRWLSRGSRFSFWSSAKNDHENDAPLLNDVEALELVDPASTMAFLLDGAVLLSDEIVTWQEQPARLLVIRPGPLAAAAEGEPLNVEVKIWLDESGAPLALERASEFRLGPALGATGFQALTFQQVDGRLLVATAQERYSGTALAVLRGRDTKRMKVTAVK
jgi:hypothetical protein